MSPKILLKQKHPIEYTAWSNMNNRCNGSGSYNKEHYKDRGISVCGRWKDSFENFYNDMGERPSKKYSLDRADNDGNYEPSNCRWATKTAQANNRTVTTSIPGMV